MVEKGRQARAVSDLRELLELLFDDYAANGHRSLGRVRYQTTHLLAEFGGGPVTAITTPRVERYRLQRLAQGAARATVNNELSILRRAFRLAKRRGLVRWMPTITALRTDNARSGFLYPAEFQKLIRALEVLDSDVADLVTWLYLTGWRKGEALGLRWADVQIATGTVDLSQRRSKSGQARHIRVGGDLLNVLKRRWERRDGPWVYHRRGKPIKRFAGPWRRATQAIGRPGLLVHDLRRSFARNALEAGVPQRVIMAIGGWVTDATFYRYAICDDGQISRALDAVAEQSAARPRPGDPCSD